MKLNSRSVLNFLGYGLLWKDKVCLIIILIILQYLADSEEDGCFRVVELIDNSQIIGTVAIRRLKQSVFADTNNYAELKRMFLSKQYRGKGIGQQCLKQH